MQKDFHYYATYCAAFLAGYPHEEALEICYGAQLADECTKTFLKAIDGPRSAATTQSPGEMADNPTDIIGLQEITRIWASFHFLPGNLHAERKASRRYLHKYRLICHPNGELLEPTVGLADNLPSIGLAMHILADTWAHRNFAGTPALAINNTNYFFYEILPDKTRRPVHFHHNPREKDDLEKGSFVNSVYQISDNSVMNLGHGRAGHLPDYSCMRYEYLPAWSDYEVFFKDNPNDYLHAFAQMVYAMECIRNQTPFEKDTYAWETVTPYQSEIMEILETRKTDTCQEWKAFGEKLSGQAIEDFRLRKYREEYVEAETKEETYLGKYFLAAMKQKSMVVNRIFSTDNLLAGISVEAIDEKLRGNKDFFALLKNRKGGQDE